jgi:hypothetical protein
MQHIRAVSQLLWPDKDREVWFSLGENHEKAIASVDTHCETASSFYYYGDVVRVVRPLLGGLAEFGAVPDAHAEPS